MSRTINILITLDENYIPYLNVMLSSLLHTNPGCCFTAYLLHRSIPDSALSSTRSILKGHGELVPVRAEALDLTDAPTTDRYPQEIYYRIFAARYLPESLDRVLYLDPDIIVNGSILPLYELPMEDYFFAAASHAGHILQRMNSLRLDVEENSPYINSGVMLMNLDRLRWEQDYDDVFHFIEEHRGLLFLPDQDIISGLYGSKIYALDPFRYNMTERLYQTHAPFEKDLDLDWVRRNSIIIHYCGRNKPWKKNYLGQLDVFYQETVERMNGQRELV